MYDKNGKRFEVGQDVLVPEGNERDIHIFKFKGIVADLHTDTGFVIVEDQDSDFFSLEPERLEIL